MVAYGVGQAIVAWVCLAFLALCIVIAIANAFDWFHKWSDNRNASRGDHRTLIQQMYADNVNVNPQAPREDFIDSYAAANEYREHRRGLGRG